MRISPKERVRQFERGGLGDVEAIDEAVADEIEVAGDGRASFAAEGTQAREHLRGLISDSRILRAEGSSANRFLQALHLVGATGGYRRRTAHQFRQLGWRQARPVPDVGEEIPGRQHGTGGKAHVLRDHRRMVVAAARQIGDEFRVGEGVRIDGLQLPVHGNRGWFAVLVPIAKLLPPELLLKDLLPRVESAGGFPPLEPAAPACSRSPLRSCIWRPSMSIP